MISVIIPAFNESKCIGALIEHLKNSAKATCIEIIVSDAGSTDNTCKIATQAGATVLHSPLKGRAAQMNFAALHAKGAIFYFVHADSFSPGSFVADIEQAVKKGFDAGRYRTKFMSNNLLLKLNAFFTRFDLFICYGGDQTLFITRKFFNLINGFDESKLIMEDYDITERIKKTGRYKIFSKAALINTRKYKNNGWLAVQTANYHAIKMYKRGASSEQIVSKYKAALRY